MTLDNAKQPEDEDKKQYPAKADVHGEPPVFSLLLKRRLPDSRSHRSAAGSNDRGIILPVAKVPDLLDFLAPHRD